MMPEKHRIRWQYHVQHRISHSGRHCSDWVWRNAIPRLRFGVLLCWTRELGSQQAGYHAQSSNVLPPLVIHTRLIDTWDATQYPSTPLSCTESYILVMSRCTGSLRHWIQNPSAERGSLYNVSGLSRLILAGGTSRRARQLH